MRAGAAGLGTAVAVAAAACVGLLMIAGQRTEETVSTRVDPAAPSPTVQTQPVHDAAAQLDPEPPEDPVSAQWDELAPARRVEVASLAFREALAAVEAGVDVAINVIVAERALSVLRPEMYGTPEGRREHQALEAALDRATGET